ncbi:MAG: dihydroorotase [Gammaproteobacteria bacterium]|nr:MAG: dihydroorotase [Gammaproteobacteria bacterium]
MDFSTNGKTVANLCIQQVRVIDPSNGKDKVTDVYIMDGMIESFGSEPANFSADFTIKGEGKWLLPGAVDLCARLCEPGFEHKGNIESETKAAAAGGITHLCCPPDTDPVIDTPAVANLVQEKGYEAGYVHVLPIGALTKDLQGSLLSEMHALHQAGCIGVTQLRAPIKDTKVLLRCLEYAATFDLTVFFQSEDHALAKNGVAHGGVNASNLGLPGIPGTAETIALNRDLLLVEQTGVKAHFGQLSCARSVELIAQAQARGLPVTADVAAHQLCFTDEVICGFDSAHHVIPPYRSPADREALIAGVQSGVIGMICSDHQPHEAAAKAAPFAVTEPGISSIETLLPCSYQWVKSNHIDTTTWVKSLSCNSAKLLNLDAGHLTQGSQANLTLFDPQGITEINEQTLLSEGKNSPWLQQSLPGKVLLTICDGYLSHQQL